MHSYRKKQIIELQTTFLTINYVLKTYTQARILKPAELYIYKQICLVAATLESWTSFPVRKKNILSTTGFCPPPPLLNLETCVLAFHNLPEVSGCIINKDISGKQGLMSWILLEETCLSWTDQTNIFLFGISGKQFYIHTSISTPQRS